MTKKAILAEAQSQQLTGPQIAYMELWVSAMSPQSSLLMVPCGLHDAAECLLRSSSMPGSSSASAGLTRECHGVGDLVTPAGLYV